MMEKLKATFDADDRAVSPVIGVILMVAITVVLAAVIGTMVLGMGDSVQSNIQAGAQVEFNDGDPGSVSVTWNNNQNADHIEVAMYNSDNGNALTLNGSTDPVQLDNVGSTVNYNESNDFNSPLSNNNEVKVVVTAVGEDGEKRTVISEKTDEI
jgi:flagellin-like protein